MNIGPLDTNWTHDAGKGLDCDQGNTDKCWIFAGLQCLYVPMSKHRPIVRLSSNFVSFKDKISKPMRVWKAVIDEGHHYNDKPNKLISQLMDRLLKEDGQWEFLLIS